MGGRSLRRIAVASSGMATVLCGFALFALSGTGQAAFAPAENGKIVFSGRDNVSPALVSQSDLFSIDPDGTGLLQLTSTADTFELGPHFLPNGREIAFLGGIPGQGFLLRSDGTHRKMLRGVGGTSISISPDGTDAVVATVTGLVMVGLERRKFKRVTRGRRASRDRGPDHSPDGKSIAFTRLGGPGGTDVFIASLDGGGLRNLTDGIPGGASQPAYSPNGEQIAFVSRDELFVIDVDGSDLRPLYVHGNSFENGVNGPVISPDGKQIVFSHTARSVTSPNQGFDIWMINTDGSNLHPITASPGFAEAGFTWQPRFSCKGQEATIVGSSGPDTLKGTKGADVIVGNAGKDRIAGRGGRDRICGGAGKDRVIRGSVKRRAKR